jgi:aminomethyltransferase
MSVVKKTKLHAFQVAQGGKMVEFAGWSMGVVFGKSTVINEHLHTRNVASVFDVSHMRQLKFHGADREKFVEFATVADVKGLPMGKGRLSFVPTPQGTILDDCIVSRYDKWVSMVVNAGREAVDVAAFRELLKDFKGDVEMEVIDDKSLVSLQGPKAMEALSAFVPDLVKLDFMCGRPATIDGKDVWITRCGYTGEDGFEISMKNEDAEAIATLLVSKPNGVDVKMAGLGARDTLRLEAGMCLYGHELTTETDPVQAGLMWTITKRRLTEGGFVGAEAIQRAAADKANVARLRVGITSKGPCARENAEVLCPKTGEKIGWVTSGSMSPSRGIGENVHQAYLQKAFTKPETEVDLVVRGKHIKGTVAKMPFVPTHYYRAPAN